MGIATLNAAHESSDRRSISVEVNGHGGEFIRIELSIMHALNSGLPNRIAGAGIHQGRDLCFVRRVGWRANGCEYHCLDVRRLFRASPDMATLGGNSARDAQ